MPSLARLRPCLALLIAAFIAAPAHAEKPVQTLERKAPRAPTQPLNKKTHLAVAMGGAVALGAFEAGILAELVHGLALYNAGLLPRDPEAAAHRFTIDVLAGASAGSMSLAVLARELYDPSADVLDSGYPERSAFHAAWVEQIGVLALMNDHRPLPLAEDPFLFDERVIYRIANSALGCSLRQGEPPAALPPALPPGARGAQALTLAPERLALGMTLSNMDGLTRPIHFEGAVYWQTFYDDRRLFLLEDGGRRVSLPRDPATEIGWNDVALTAIASGAFPFAFEPVLLERRGVEYDPLPREFAAPVDTRAFHYADGGYFDNDPLALAQQLAALIDTEPSRAAHPEPIAPEQMQSNRALAALLNPVERDRRFIYLAPQVPVMLPAEEESLAAQRPPGATVSQLVPYANRIIGMGLGAAGGQGFREYIRAADANEAALRHLLVELHALAGDDARAEDLLRALDFMAEHGVASGDIALLMRFATYARAELAGRRVAPRDDLAARLERSIDFRFDWGEAAPAAAWLEHAASWQHRQLFLELFRARGLLATNNFILITATDEQPVAGGAFSHFGGFFNRELREFDFLLGRYFAQQTLMHDLGIALADTIGTAELEARRAPLRPIRSLASHFATLDERIAFRDKAENRLRGYVDHLALPALVRPWAFSTGNRWLDTAVYHQPRGFLLRAFAGYDELHTLSAGAALDPLSALSRLASKEHHKRYYDDLFRASGFHWPQPFLAGEYGYWHPQGRRSWDLGVTLQLHLHLSSWIAPRPTLEFGRRYFDGSPAEGWYHSIGIEVGSVHLGVKTDRSPSLRHSRPQTLLRMGFSFRPATAMRALATLF
ncbi:hypothetical protein FJ251_07505 [bacterium]|nr:hypothetical protein [bacterium]